MPRLLPATLAAAACIALAAPHAHAAAPALPAARDLTTDVYKKLIADAAPAIVTIKFVMKFEGGGDMFGQQEQEAEASGILIDDKGLVLCANSQIGGLFGLISRMRQMDVSMTPTDMKVLIGDDTEGVDADIIARDSELDLAWIRIKEPKADGYPFIDLSKGVAAGVGDRVFAVTKLGKFFDRVPYVAEGRVAGKAAKPRELLLPNGFEPSVGLPVFGESGVVVGVAIVQLPDAEDLEANPDLLQEAQTAVLPIADVNKATTRALESVEPAKAE